MNKELPVHHAIFVEGNETSTLKFFGSALKKRGIEVLGNPDVVQIRHDVFGIDEARELAQISLTAPISEEKKVIIITFRSITVQAQNALLKLFEDPNPKSEFLISSLNANSLLPTLVSRLFVVSQNHVQIDTNTAKKFISSNVGEKMSTIDKMLSEYKEVGDKTDIRNFLSSVCTELEKQPREKAAALRAAARSLTFIDAPSASVKLLLESLALNIL